MDKTIKYLGGIGYALILIGPLLSISRAFVGGVSVIGVILAAVAWIMLGNRLKDWVMTANGVMMIVGPVLMFAVTFGLLSAQLHGETMSPAAFLKVFSSIIFAALTVGVICWVLQVLAHLRAGNTLGIAAFKYSAYCQIASFVISIASLAVILKTATTTLIQTTKLNPSLFIKAFGPGIALFGLGVVLMIAANALSAVAFFSIED